MMYSILKRHNKSFLAAYIAVVLFIHVMHFGNVAAINKIEVLDVRLDYLLHALVFMPWGVLVWLGFDINFRQATGKTFLWILAGIVFASVAEYIQYYLPYRAFNINDVAGNVSGILLGSVVFFWEKPRGKDK